MWCVYGANLEVSKTKTDYQDAAEEVLIKPPFSLRNNSLLYRLKTEVQDAPRHYIQRRFGAEILTVRIVVDTLNTKFILIYPHTSKEM